MAFLHAGLRLGQCERLEATSAFASIAKSGSSVIFIDSLHGSTIRRWPGWVRAQTVVRESAFLERLRIFDQRSGSTGNAPIFPDFCIEEGTMMGQFAAVAKELRQHGQRTRSESLVDERFLPIQGFNRRATRQRIASPASASTISENSSLTVRSRFALRRLRAFQRLAENKLAAIDALLPRSSQ